jgi:hypothetical protein
MMIKRGSFQTYRNFLILGHLFLQNSMKLETRETMNFHFHPPEKRNALLQNANSKMQWVQ